MLGKKYFQLINNIALIVVLFSSLAPAISQAFPVDGTSKPFIIEICSANGTKRIEATIVGAITESQQQIPAQRDARLHAGHCSICCTGHNSTLVTLADDTNLFLIDDGVYQAIATYNPPITPLFFHNANLAQAPPQIVRI